MSPYLGPASQVRRFPELQDCPDEPSTEPAGIVSICGFSIWKEASDEDLQKVALLFEGICSDVGNMQVTGRKSPVSLAHRWNITLSLLTQCLGTVLPPVGRWLGDDAFPVLHLFSATV